MVCSRMDSPLAPRHPVIEKEEAAVVMLGVVIRKVVMGRWIYRRSRRDHQFEKEMALCQLRHHLFISITVTHH
jgi:hypothetical protein